MHQVNCPFIQNGIHFSHDHVKACCTNAMGPILIENYKGEDINWEELANKRTELKQKFANGAIPEYCKNCFELEKFKTNGPLSDSKYIDVVYISHWLHCNCDCTYCVRNFYTAKKFDKKIKKSEFYNLLPILKQMVNKKILAPGAIICITGGEPTVLKELDGILDLLLPYVENPIKIFSSGIIYNKAIAKGFKLNKCELTPSIDAGTKETYEQIKRVPRFNDFKKTIKKYVNSSPNARNLITLKYILINDVNDNVEEVEKWLLLTKELNVKNIRLDVEFSNTNLNDIKKIPKHYYEIYNHVKNRAKELNLNIFFSEQVNKFLEKGYVF